MRFFRGSRSRSRQNGNQRQAVCPPNHTPYIIKSGDTYFRLAKRFGTTMGALLAANPGVDPDRLVIGQTICLPIQVTPMTTNKVCPPSFRRYTIQAGDTFYGLAQRFNTSASLIKYYNLDADENNLQIGQVLCIPPTEGTLPTCPPGLTPYTVQPGDNIYELAKRRKTTVENIVKYNPGIDPDNLQIGQLLCIP